MDWSIMFVRIEVVSSGSTEACQRSARAPMGMTAGSSRKKPTTVGAKSTQSAPAIVIMSVPILRQ